MASDLTILILAKSIDGGTGTHVQTLQDDLARFFPNRHVSIVTNILEKPRYREVPHDKFEFLHQKNTYHEYYNLSVVPIMRLLQEFIWLKKNLKTLAPTIIISLDVHCNILSLLTRTWSNPDVRIIATTHIDLTRTLADKSSPLVQRLLYQAVKHLYPKADALTAVSRQLAQSLTTDFELEQTVTTIYNGLALPTKPEPKRLPGGKKIIITIGRLVPQKDHETLIRSFALYHEEEPASELWILSDGPLKDRLSRLTKTLRISDAVVFHGWVSDIHTYLSKADLFVLSSRREGFGYVLLEAMMHGLPVISTDTPYGPREILGDGKYGQLTPVGDAENLQSAIRKLLGSPELYHHYARQSCTRVHDFSNQNMLQSYKQLIDQLLSE